MKPKRKGVKAKREEVSGDSGSEEAMDLEIKKLCAAATIIVEGSGIVRLYVEVCVGFY